MVEGRASNHHVILNVRVPRTEGVAAEKPRPLNRDSARPYNHQKAGTMSTPTPRSYRTDSAVGEPCPCVGTGRELTLVPGRVTGALYAHVHDCPRCRPASRCWTCEPAGTARLADDLAAMAEAARTATSADILPSRLQAHGSLTDAARRLRQVAEAPRA